MTNRIKYENLRHSLRSAGIDVWDVDSLVGGLSVSDQLMAATSACDSCVYLATTESVTSRWCHAELGAFWGSGKPVIIFLDDQLLSESQLPPEIQSQFRVLTYEKVIEAVRFHGSINKETSFPRPMRIPGLRLFQHPGYYPVDLEPLTNRPLPNREVFAKAIDYLLDKSRNDRLAAMDLVYLRFDNLPHFPDLVIESYRQRFSELISRYELKRFLKEFAAEKDRVFKDYRRIVDDLGNTLRGVHFEILLHDVRNPFRSIIEARNSEAVSGRVAGDPSTRFVVNYVKNQGEDILALEAGSKVAYLKQFTTSKRVKATTTPVFDDIYGLVGVLCCNIDVEAIQRLSASERDQLIENFCANTGTTPEFEK